MSGNLSPPPAPLTKRPALSIFPPACANTRDSHSCLHYLQRSPAQGLLDLPSEAIQLILTHMAASPVDGVVPFDAWPLAMVSTRLRQELYNAVQKVDLVSCFEVPHPYNSRQSFASVAADILLGPLTRCHNLRELDITGCDSIDDRQLASFFHQSQSTTLRSFTAVICMRQTDLLVRHLCESTHTSLLHLDLAGCDRFRHGALFPSQWNQNAYRPCNALTDASLLSATSLCVNLRSLTLRRAMAVTDRGLRAIASLSALDSLVIHRLPEISDEGVVAIANGISKLSRLDLLSCPTITDDALDAIAVGRATRMLKAICLSFNSTITSGGVRSLVRSLSMLRDLRVEHCSLLNETWSDGLPARHAAALKHVSLRGVTMELTSRGVRDIAHIASLQAMNLGYIGSVDAKVLEKIKASFPNLDTLLMEACNKVDDEAAAVIADIPTLRALDVSWCSSLTSAGIKAIVSGVTGARLRRLTVGPINGSDNDVLQTIARSCPQLARLSLCGEIDEDVVAWLKKHCSAQLEYADVVLRRSQRRMGAASPRGVAGRRSGSNAGSSR